MWPFNKFCINTKKCISRLARCVVCVCGVCVKIILMIKGSFIKNFLWFTYNNYSNKKKKKMMWTVFSSLHFLKAKLFVCYVFICSGNCFANINNILFHFYSLLAFQKKKIIKMWTYQYIKKKLYRNSLSNNLHTHFNLFRILNSFFVLHYVKGIMFVYMKLFARYRLALWAVAASSRGFR